MKKYKYKKQMLNKNSPKEVFDLIITHFKIDCSTGLITNTKTSTIYTQLNKKGYVQNISLRYNNIEYLVAPHRLVYYLTNNDFPDKKECIDHINGIRSDNRPANLRKASIFENQQNAKKRFNRKYTSTYKGVFIEKYPTYTKYCVTIGFNKKIYNIARFKDELIAAKFYDSAARYYHANFANCNFSEIFIAPQSVEDLRKLKQTHFKNS